MIVFALAVSIWSGVRIVPVAAPVTPALRRRVDVVAAAADAVALAYGIAPDPVASGRRQSHISLRLASADRGRGTSRRNAARRSDGLGRRYRRPRGAPPLMAVRTAPLLLATQPSIWTSCSGYELPGS